MASSLDGELTLLHLNAFAVVSDGQGSHRVVNVQSKLRKLHISLFFKKHLVQARSFQPYLEKESVKEKLYQCIFYMYSTEKLSFVIQISVRTDIKQGYCCKVHNPRGLSVLDALQVILDKVEIHFKVGLSLGRIAVFVILGIRHLPPFSLVAGGDPGTAGHKQLPQPVYEEV